MIEGDGGREMKDRSEFSPYSGRERTREKEVTRILNGGWAVVATEAVRGKMKNAGTEW